MKTRMKWMAPALLLSLLAGCNLGDNDEFQRQNLSQARLRWEGSNVSSYSYILELQCFCAPASQLRPVLVTVENGAVASLLYYHQNPAQRTPAPAEVFGPYDTVEELFAIIDDAIDRDADRLQVGYDQEYGFPDIANIDYESGGSEQILFFVTQFQPAAGS
ncbi:MAG TPA: DUF6174 domain-containing protein [Longimicrobium sp.]|nr:DUF6174 domain-containing protein [Longimicrobium sp.]